eukprot:CAMPEP_0179202742 /NCGR_PEP_ID=MMETSP0796-20121207/101008_1 /TAXON_ID=73915 /ORGANISM="Pyrodinium bahamense, Strain pbaha01" /LENGTH=41 /DNA_ID= /DNA_START= /DNA_END= /DNA_ORIENTATION=
MPRVVSYGHLAGTASRLGKEVGPLAQQRTKKRATNGHCHHR